MHLLSKIETHARILIHWERVMEDLSGQNRKTEKLKRVWDRRRWGKVRQREMKYEGDQEEVR